MAAAAIGRYGVNLPWQDDWDLVPAVLRASHGQLTWADLWRPHNEHRMVLVKLIVIALARLTGFDVRAELWVGFVFAILTLLLLRDRVMATFGAGTTGATLTAATSLWLFSAVQFEKWLWPVVAVQWTLHGLALVAVAWAVRWPARWPGLLVGMVAAIVSALTMAAGVAVTVVPLAVAVASARGRLRALPLSQLLFGLCVPITFAVCYVHGLQRAMPGPVSGAVPGFWFAFLGSPLGFSLPTLSVSAGLAGVGLLVAASTTAVARHGLGRTLPWLVLAAEVMIVALATAVGRARHGAVEAMVSRYALVAALFWIALTMLVVLAVEAPAPVWRRRAALVAAGVVVVLYGHTYVRGLFHAAAFRYQQMVARVLLPHYESAPDAALHTLYPYVGGMRRYARVLERLRLGPFADLPARSAPPYGGALDAAAPWGYDGRVEAIECSQVIGWAWNALDEAPLGVEVYDGERLLGTITAGIYRLDLRAAGKGSGAHAFRYALGAEVWDGRPHRLRARIAGIPGDLPPLSPGGPLVCGLGSTNEPPAGANRR